MAISEIPSLHLKPVAYKTNKLYLKLPEGSIGNMTFARTSIATRVNKEGLIEEVTTGIPRLDYPLINGVVQSCPDLLLEPTSTNLILRSEEFDNGSWTKSGSLGITVNPDFAISPDGNLTADKLIPNNGSGVSLIRQNNGNLVGGNHFIVSAYFKVDGFNNIRLIITNPTQSNNAKQFFNISNGTMGNLSSTGVSNVLSFIEDAGNGWFKCSLSAVFGVEDGIQFIIEITDASDNSILGDGIKGVQIWGAQLEELPYATSYIKTIGSTVTRATETLINAGDITTFNSEEGVLYVQMSALFNDLTKRQISISFGNSTDRIIIRYDDVSNRISAILTKSGTQTSMNHTLTDETDLAKIAFKWKLNDFALWVNGIEEGSDNTGNVEPTGTYNVFNFADGIGTGSPFYGRIRNLKVYKTALTDEQLEELTT